MNNLMFRFESDFAATLRCVPMIVRFKLDICGIKVSLTQWSRFSAATRLRLAQLTVASEDQVEQYRTFLCQAICEEAGEQPASIPRAAYVEHVHPPAAVIEKMRELQMAPPPREKWLRLSTLQRFALVKLTRAGHENVNFLPALREFGLAGE